MAHPATATTVASTVATITVDGAYTEVEVFNVAGTDTIWVSDTGGNPTVGGQGFWPVPPGMRVKVRPPFNVAANTASVKVISAGVNTVTVFGSDC